jgi:hypothetical protein
VIEAKSQWARMQSRRFGIVVWWATSVEIRSAIAKLVRADESIVPAKIFALNRVDVLRRQWREVIPSDEVREMATALVDKYPLRAADSLQLAAALVWCRDRPKGRTFLTADERLAEAAKQAGFTVLQP